MSTRTHTIVYGQTGTGQTFTLQTLLYRHALNDAQVIVPEPQEPYREAAAGRDTGAGLAVAVAAPAVAATEESTGTPPAPTNRQGAPA